MAKLADGEATGAIADIRVTYDAAVIFVYLCEAHAADSWPLSTRAPRNHKSLDERQTAGAAFLRQWPALAQQIHSWFIDDLDDQTTITNGLWPERYLLLKEGRVAWKSTLSETPGDLSNDLHAAATENFA